jgi:hypothetical protein
MSVETTIVWGRSLREGLGPTTAKSTLCVRIDLAKSVFSVRGVNDARLGDLLDVNARSRPLNGAKLTGAQAGSSPERVETLVLWLFADN